MNLSQCVEEEIYRSPFVTEALQAGIVNTSSLARFIIPTIQDQLGDEVTVAAISMAISRLSLTSARHLDKSIEKFMSLLGDITVRSDLTDFSFKNSSSLLQCQAKLLGHIENESSHFYSSCKGVHETTFICSEALKKQVQVLFVEEIKIMSRSNLAAVSVNLPPANLDTYGVYYTILKKLAWKGINVVEVLSTSHEISLVVSNEDVEEVFSIILRLKHGKS